MRNIWKLLSSISTKHARRASQRISSRQLNLESLEERVVPTTRIWNGLGVDNNWMTAANWAGGVAPSAGDDLIFPTFAPQTSNFNNFAVNTSFHSITMADHYTINGVMVSASPNTPITLNGNAIDLTAGIVSDLSLGSLQANTVHLAGITLLASETFSNLSSSVLNMFCPIALNGFTLVFDTATEIDSGGGIGGNGNVTKNSGGFLRFTLVNPVNSYIGTTTINAGTVEIDAQSELGGSGSNPVIVNTGGTLLVDGEASMSTIDLTSPMTLNGPGAPNIANQGSLSIVQALGVVQIDSQISLNSNSTIGYVPVFDNPTNSLQLDTSIQTNGHDLTLNGNTTLARFNSGTTGSGRLINASGTLQGTGQIGGPLVMNGGTLIPGGIVTGSPSPLFAAGANFHSGSTFFVSFYTFNVGTKTFIASSELQVSAPNAGFVTLGGIFPVFLDGSLNGLNPATGSTFTIIQASGGITGTFSGLPDGAFLAISREQFQIHYINGTSGGSVTLTRTSSNVFIDIWTGASTATGNWTDPNNWKGNVAPSSGDALQFPDRAARLTNNANDFDINTVFDSITFTGTAGGYDLPGDAIFLVNGLHNSAGANTIDLDALTLSTSQTFFGAALTINSFIILNGNSVVLTLDGMLTAAGSNSINGVINGSGSITKTGSVIWALSGNNTYFGGTTIVAGALAVSNNSGLGAVNSPAVVNKGGSLQISNNITIAQQLTISGNGNNLSPGAIDIKDTIGDDTLSGTIILGSASSILSANIGLNNLFISGTVLNNGFNLSIVGGGGYTTVLTGNMSGIGQVLNFGSIFSGTGSLTSPLNINQGTLSPGVNGPGVLTSANVTFGLGTIYQPFMNNNVAGSGYSQLISNGSVNLTGATLNPSLNFTPAPGDSFVIMEATGAITGTFNGLPDGSPLTLNGQNFIIRYINGSSSTLGPLTITGRTVIYSVPAATTISFVTSPNQAVAGQSVTFTAVVSSPAAAVAGIQPNIITGTVSFFDMGQLLGSSQVAGGAAVFAASSLTAGNHSITANYSGDSTFLASSITIVIPVNGGAGWHDTLTGDFLGNGKTEIASRTGGGQWWVAVSNGSGFTNQLWDTWNEAANWTDVQVGDFNGDGKADIAGRTSAGQWWVAISSGSSFTNQFWTTWSPAVTWTDVKVGDFTGDGKADIAGRILGFGQWWTAVSTGSSFTSAMWANWNENANVTWVDVKVGDFNGDKKADLTARWSQGGSWWTSISTGSSFTTNLWASWNPAARWVDVNVGDFNGDGKADLTARVLDSGQWWAAISMGTSFTTGFWTGWAPTVTWVDVKVGDFNKDGKADIVGRIQETGQIWVGISNGSGFTNFLWTGWSPGVTWVDVKVGDFNGDGATDIAGRIAQTGQWWIAESKGSNSFTNQLWTTWAV
jgi:autotransporter-associated beta strand protein